MDVPPITECLATKCRRYLTLVSAILLGALWTVSILADPLQAQDTQEEAAGGADQQEDEKAQLAKQTQNPISNLISVPFQNNTSFGIGEFDRTSNVLNIQPVIPVRLSSSINLISRAILPIISAPDATRPEGTTWGLGDPALSQRIGPPPLDHLRAAWANRPSTLLISSSESSRSLRTSWLSGRWQPDAAVLYLLWSSLIRIRR